MKNHSLSRTTLGRLATVHNIPEREWEPDIGCRREANDLTTRIEVADGAGSRYLRTLGEAPTRLKPGSSDKAIATDTAFGYVELLQATCPGPLNLGSVG